MPSRTPELENNIRGVQRRCWLPAPPQPEGPSRTGEACAAQPTLKQGSWLILSPFLPELEGAGEEMVMLLAGWDSPVESE